MTPKMPKYCRHSTVPIDEVLSEIQKNDLLFQGELEEQRAAKKGKAVFNGQRVGVNSLRLRTFLHKGLTCKCCGLQASFFAIERNHSDEEHGRPYHLNLWGVNSEGEEILFTHDHIKARALGGADNMSNTQTMCVICNNTKGVKEGQLVAKMKKDKK